MKRKKLFAHPNIEIPKLEDKIRKKVLIGVRIFLIAIQLYSRYSSEVRKKFDVKQTLLYSSI